MLSAGMEPLEPPESHFLSAALGWVGLRNLREAKAELEQISPARRRHPDVLEVRWSICAQEENWTEALQVARELLHAAPERASGWLHQAYALRRVPDGGLKPAWEALLPAFDKFAKEPLIPFNLACYACQLGDLAAARTWLKRAAALGGSTEVKALAFSDPDLEPLRDYLAEL